MEEMEDQPLGQQFTAEILISLKNVAVLLSVFCGVTDLMETARRTTQKLHWINPNPGAAQ